MKDIHNSIYDLDKKTARELRQLENDYLNGIIDRQEYLDELEELTNGKCAVMSRAELEQILNY